MIFLFDRVENIVGKGENAGYQHFLLFPQCFLKVLFFGVIKSCDCVVKTCSFTTINLSHYNNIFGHLPTNDERKAAQMMISVLKKVQTLRAKENKLVTNIFSFSHKVFNSLLSRNC